MRQVLLALSVSLMLATEAHARTTIVRDPNDARGPLDARRVVKVGGHRPIWKVKSAHQWRTARVRDTGYVLVYLDTFGSERYDYVAIVRSTGARMAGRLVRDRLRKPDSSLGYLPVWRRSRRSVSVKIPLRRMILPEARERYRWYVQTLMTGPRCRRVCFDLAPNQGGVEGPVPPPRDDD
jgi:hypothetical protein